MAIYMWRDWERQPGANTIAYYPFDSTNTVNDLSGNSNNLTNNGVAFGTYDGVDCAYFDGSSYMTKNESLFTGSATFTVNLWYQRQADRDNHFNIFSVGQANGTNSFILWLGTSPQNVLMLGGWNNDKNTGYTTPLNTWINLCVAHSSGTVKVYLNGNTTPIYTGSVGYTITSTKTVVGAGTTLGDPIIGLQSRLIVESAERTTQEISDYYDATKTIYGIS